MLLLTHLVNEFTHVSIEVTLVIDSSHCIHFGRLIYANVFDLLILKFSFSSMLANVRVFLQLWEIGSNSNGCLCTCFDLIRDNYFMKRKKLKLVDYLY